MRSIALHLMMVAVAACAAGHRAVLAPSMITPDEYAIYRRVLGDSQSDEPVVVVATAGRDEDADTIARLTADPELRAAFAEAAQVPGLISATELRVSRARVVADPGIPRWRTPLSEQERPWKQLRAQYGAHAVFVHFSRVGFNRARTRAVVMYSARSGPPCNFGVFGAVYQRERGRWHPIANSAEFC